MNEYLEPAVVAGIIVVIGFCFQLGLFVRPEDLEKKHREILDDAEKKFASLSMVKEIKSQSVEMKQKIDQIYEILLNNKQNK